MFKKIFTIIALSYLFLAKSSFAFKPETFISVVHLVDSADAKTLQNIKLAYQSSTPSAIFNDWLLTSSVLKSSTVSAYFKNLIADDKLQSVGLFLEADTLPLDKMTVEERKVELDSKFQEYFNIFGTYPKFVSARVMDTKSLNYLQKKYGLLSLVLLPGQHPEIPSNVGGYNLVPYIANNQNFFLPSSSTKNRNSVVVSEGFYLSQDSLLPRIELVSQKKFNEFTQITFWTNLSEEKVANLSNLKQIYHQIKSVSDKYSLNQKSLADFSDWYLARYPESTPAFYFQDKNDHLYQSPWYRLGLTQSNKQLALQNLFVYDQKIYDPSYSIPNPGESGVLSIPTIDLSQFGAISLQGDLYYSRLKNFDYWKMSLKNQTEEIALYPDSIVFKNITTLDIKTELVSVSNKSNQTTWTPKITEASFNLGTLTFFTLLFVALAFYLKKNKTKPPYFGLALVLITSLVSLRSGQLYPFGLGFWGPHGHDAIFHLSLIQKFIQEPFSLSHPQISQSIIANYHLFFDYFSAALVSIFNLNLQSYYFVYFPLISGIVIVLLLNKLLNNFKFSPLQKNITYLIAFFGSSLGFVVRLLQNHDYLTGESAFWSNQAVSMFLNPPFVLSLILLLSFLNLHFKKPKSLLSILFLVLLGGALAQIKVYAFILLVLSLFLNRQLFLSVLVGATGALLSLPFSSLGSSPFIFNPLWFVRSMFESADRIYLASVASAWQVFEVNGSFSRILILSLAGVIVFIIGNLGVRTLGLVHLLRSRSGNNTDSLISKIIFLSLLLPLLFTQSINPWNSIQFLYYGLFFLSIYTALSLPKNIILLSVLIFIGVFGSVGTIRDYATSNSSSRVSHIELLGLSTLRSAPQGIVLSPLHTGRSSLSAPQPLYDYVSTAYISALTGKQEFLSDTINLDITGVDYTNKKVDVLRFYNTEDTEWAKQFLKENNISYVYETPLQKIKLSPADLNLTPIFFSGEVNIYTTKP